MMNKKEKLLYHQIHPTKLATDIITSIFSTYCAWTHQLIVFAIVFVVPSIVATSLVMNYSNLDKLRESRLGAYVAKYMTSFFVAMRAVGQLVIWIAAWYQQPRFIVLGAIIILLAWLNGKYRQ